ncbi:DUF2533 family protein [Ammoniphilus resinae]|uniref:DUF2533 family protein n=1 Tax=Ammoniphilus resinae TaxID=861532 RepID=A0ABS4GJQ9_9BACL|nr:hypothetical protein [Ammoniphilus resinae]
MSVHEEISKKTNKTWGIIQTYRKLDEKREAEIEKVILQCQNNEAFSVDQINKVTEEINSFAAINHLPSRKFVTKQMVEEAAQN